MSVENHPVQGRCPCIAWLATLAFFAALLPASGGHAATYAWTGGSGIWFSSGLTLSNNWTPAGTLTPADSLVFGGLETAAYQITQNGAAQVTNLTVYGDAPYVELFGSTLTISGSLVVNQAHVAIYNPVEFVTGAVVDLESNSILELYNLTGSGNFTARAPVNGYFGIYAADIYSGTMTISRGEVYLGGSYGGSIVNNGGTFLSDGAVAGSYVQSSGTGSFTFMSTLSVNQTGGLIQLSGGAESGNVVGSLTGSGGTIDMLYADAVLTIGDANSTTYAGSIVGNGSISKAGGGNLVLAGTSSYTGATSVEFGRLSVDGALGNTPVAVLAGAELGGSGSIGGPVSVAGFGTLSPGNSIESIATGAATFAAGAVFDYEVDSTNPLSLGSAADLLVVNGGLNLDPGNGTILTFADLASSPNPFVNDTTIFALINYSGLWNGGLFRYGGTELADGDRFFVGGQEWEIDYDRSSSAGLDNFTADYLPSGKFVTVMAVPEPSTVVMAVAGLSYGGFSVWRRRKRANASAQAEDSPVNGTSSTVFRPMSDS